MFLHEAMLGTKMPLPADRGREELLILISDDYKLHTRHAHKALTRHVLSFPVHSIPNCLLMELGFLGTKLA